MQDDFDHNLPYDPSKDMLEKMHTDDDVQRAKDAERFTPKQKEWARGKADRFSDDVDPASVTPDALADLAIREQAAIDKGRLVVGKVTTNVGPNYDGTLHRIMAGPDGRGCVREGFPVPPGMGEDPAVWPLPPTHPSPRPSAADKQAQRNLEEAIERLSEEKKKRDRQDHIDELARRAREEAQATIRGDLGPEEMETLKKIDRKDTNPKDAVGIRKWRVFTTVPFTIIWELGVAMMEGARKYGRHNYRVAGVRGSVYIDAAMGHLTQWWEGEDNDLDTGLSHITKAMASLCVLRDAMIQGKFVDDRPPKTDVAAVRNELQARMDEVFERIPTALPAYVEGDQHDTQD